MMRCLTISLILALSLTACETFSGRDGGSDDLLLIDAGLLLALDQRFADVPLPADSKADLERTYIYESKTLQIGRMVYTVKASVNEVAQFYIRECAALDWQLETVLEADGAELLFNKPEKRLRVSIRDLGRAKSGSLLVVHLTPVD